MVSENLNSTIQSLFFNYKIPRSYSNDYFASKTQFQSLFKKICGLQNSNKKQIWLSIIKYAFKGWNVPNHSSLSTSNTLYWLLTLNQMLKYILLQWCKITCKCTKKSVILVVYNFNLKLYFIYQSVINRVTMRLILLKSLIGLRQINVFIFFTNEEPQLPTA